LEAAQRDQRISGKATSLRILNLEGCSSRLVKAGSLLTVEKMADEEKPK